MGTSQFSLRWNNYVQHITCAFDNLRSEEDLVDVTLSCEGKKIYAHKMLLSACSNYFKDVFKDNPCKHPVIIFRNVKYEDLVAIIDFMYHGEVNVEQDQLSSFLTTAEMLAVQGLSVGSTSKEELRKRQPVFVDTSPANNPNIQDISSQIKQNIKQLSRPLGTQNPPGPTTLPSRNDPPVNRKRRLSPSSKPSCFEKESSIKRKDLKDESDDMEDDNSYEEDDGMINVAQLQLPREETDLPTIKLESPPSPDDSDALGVSGDQEKVGQAGTSGNSETTDSRNLEEYLEEDDTNEDCEEMFQTAYVIVNDNGEVEYVDEAAITSDDQDSIYIGNTTGSQKAVDNNTDDVAVAQSEKDNDGDDVMEYSSAVEYIYAEGVGQNNEIIIGGVPKFECGSCERSFKRLDSLRKHQSLHSGETECPSCGSVFSRVTHLTRHMRVKHPDWSGTLPVKRSRQPRKT